MKSEGGLPAQHRKFIHSSPNPFIHTPEPQEGGCHGNNSPCFGVSTAAALGRRRRRMRRRRVMEPTLEGLHSCPSPSSPLTQIATSSIPSPHAFNRWCSRQKILLVRFPPLLGELPYMNICLAFLLPKLPKRCRRVPNHQLGTHRHALGLLCELRKIS